MCLCDCVCARACERRWGTKRDRLKEKRKEHEWGTTYGQNMSKNTIHCINSYRSFPLSTVFACLSVSSQPNQSFHFVKWPHSNTLPPILTPIPTYSLWEYQPVMTYVWEFLFVKVWPLHNRQLIASRKRLP